VVGMLAWVNRKIILDRYIEGIVQFIGVLIG
jgi:hypothetical protein